MSQFSTMTTRERKIQAAAICREIQGPEEMDLCRKVNAPKDIMFEELSLSSNRGSQLFKRRQMRSEKYTFESIQNQNQAHTLSTNGMLLHDVNGNATENGENHAGVNEPPNTPPNTPDTRVLPDPDCIAPGYGGPLKDVPPEKFNITSVPKSYHSPWEQAICNNPELADTLVTHLAEPEPRPELPGYKSFNRVATPFGGFGGKTPRPAPVRGGQQQDPVSLPEFHHEVQADSVLKRFSFNRTALGWTTVGTADLLSRDSLEPTFIPESDEL